MVYITVRQSPMYHQMTWEELMFSDNVFESSCISRNTAATRTYRRDSLSPKFLAKVQLMHMYRVLQQFNESVATLRECKREDLYDTFYIPKHSGGLRRIDAPKQELMDALRRLKRIFEEDFYALYHTAAFAYIKNRSTIDAVKKHQSNESRWFAKLDLHDFFGSTTLDFVLNQFSMVFPFSQLMKYEEGKKELSLALELAFLNGGLPQGTPISPLITNIMMIPVDYELYNTLRNYDGQKYVYTRYADDFIISSRYDFDVKKVEKLVVDTLAGFSAPFTINNRKTRYGSSAGSNWNLGVMLNKDNKITVGHKKHKQFKSMLYNYTMDKRKGVRWSLEDLQSLSGLYSYYTMVERDVIDEIVKYINRKLDTDVLKEIKNDLRAYAVA